MGDGDLVSDLPDLTGLPLGDPATVRSPALTAALDRLRREAGPSDALAGFNSAF